MNVTHDMHHIDHSLTKAYCKRSFSAEANIGKSHVRRLLEELVHENARTMSSFVTTMQPYSLPTCSSPENTLYLGTKKSD